jgi:hypothetical protein
MNFNLYALVICADMVLVFAWGPGYGLQSSFPSRWDHRCMTCSLLEIGFLENFALVYSNSDPSYHHLPNSWDYKYEALHLTLKTFFEIELEKPMSLHAVQIEHKKQEKKVFICRDLVSYIVHRVIFISMSANLEMNMRV